MSTRLSQIHHLWPGRTKQWLEENDQKLKKWREEKETRSDSSARSRRARFSGEPGEEKEQAMTVVPDQDVLDFQKSLDRVLEACEFYRQIKKGLDEYQEPLVSRKNKIRSMDSAAQMLLEILKKAIDEEV
uniref:Uncharacterized protein n=1 Tax=Ditylenchus dipsaci TaxID=166011 RepID=A0A915D6E1_9BILA